MTCKLACTCASFLMSFLNPGKCANCGKWDENALNYVRNNGKVSTHQWLKQYNAHFKKIYQQITGFNTGGLSEQKGKGDQEAF